MNPFVGVRQVSSSDELKQLLETGSQSSYYFLRWPHKVSGIVHQITEFPSPEGQMFNYQFELRWKQRKSGYDVLLLSTINPESEWGFAQLGSSWTTIDRSAHLYRSNETRFPQEFSYQDVKIGQRYFIDEQTATTHFIALTIQP